MQSECELLIQNFTLSNRSARDGIVVKKEERRERGKGEGKRSGQRKYQNVQYLTLMSFGFPMKVKESITFRT